MYNEFLKGKIALQIEPKNHRLSSKNAVVRCLWENTNETRNLVSKVTVGPSSEQFAPTLGAISAIVL